MHYLKSSDPSLRGQFPFFTGDDLKKPLRFYLEQAGQVLCSVLEQYKTIYGKSEVDQKLLI